MARKLNNDNSNFWTGGILLLIGSVVLLRKMEFPIPSWIFSWEIILIAVGLLIGVRHQFRGPAWFILIIIGSVSMLDNILPGLELRKFAWPVIFIIVGLFIILRPKWKGSTRPNKTEVLEPLTKETEANNQRFDTLDIAAVFGSVKRVVLSKNFKGGEVVSVMGGSEINFSQADINGRVMLEAVNIMGGTKLIIPRDWDVQSEMVAIFGGVEDKRDIQSLNVDPNKVLVLEGVCIFGGLEIKSY